MCQIYADPPFLGREKVNDPPLFSSHPPSKNECSLKILCPFKRCSAQASGKNVGEHF